MANQETACADCRGTGLGEDGCCSYVLHGGRHDSLCGWGEDNAHNRPADWDGEKPCSFCDGSGVCPDCDGEGFVWYSAGGYERSRPCECTGDDYRAWGDSEYERLRDMGAA